MPGTNAMTLSITKRYRFDAAHKIEDHPGKCKRLHGHGYEFEVEMSGPLNGMGMVADFDVLDEAVMPILADWDHTYLNEVLGDRNVTAERMVAAIGALLCASEALADLTIVRVTLWETPTSSATWRPGK